MILDELSEILEGVTRYENYISARCCFHEETRPSFMVWEDYYKCYSCGASGKPENLLQLVGGLPVQAKPEIKFVNPWRGWIRKYGRLGLALKAANSNLPCSYLSRRGIEEKTQRELKLGYLDDWYTFPLFNKEHDIIGAIARRGEDNPSQAKYVTPPHQNNRHIIYVPDWELLEEKRDIVICFGILDTITLTMNNVASASIIGLFVDPSVFDFIRKRIHIVPDQKEEKFALELASKLGWRGDTVKVRYPEGCKDISDTYTKEPKLLKSMLAGIK